MYKQYDLIKEGKLVTTATFSEKELPKTGEWLVRVEQNKTLDFDPLTHKEVVSHTIADGQSINDFSIELHDIDTIKLRVSHHAKIMKESTLYSHFGGRQEHDIAMSKINNLMAKQSLGIASQTEKDELTALVNKMSDAHAAADVFNEKLTAVDAATTPEEVEAIYNSL